MSRDLSVLRDRAGRAMEALSACRLCPRACGVNRLRDEAGFCRAGALSLVASAGLHDGEEPPISGTRGSGTVFFSRCNLTCLFCQNYPISQMGVGRITTAEDLGEKLLRLERKGAHNVNFVTPTPHVPQLLAALLHARERGFSLPVVYNTNGYDGETALALLDGVVDIYLPDVKYRSADAAEAISGVRDYPAHNFNAVAEMFRQVGLLAVGADGIARRGVLLRHLVLPGRIAETKKVLADIRGAFGPGVPLSLMGQYFPAYKAPALPGFHRKLSANEYEEAVAAAESLGFDNVFIQEIACPDERTSGKSS